MVRLLSFLYGLVAYAIFFCAFLSAAAADGVTVITQAKALAGKVTPGDKPGFPVTLSTSGSYRFASDLHVPAKRLGIAISAFGVTIDLNGFGLYGGTTAERGIEARDTSGGITIRNGTISDFKSDAIRGIGPSWTIENMRIWFNGGNGVSAGHLLRVRNSTLYLNKMNGVIARNHGAILDSTIDGSGMNGIVCEYHCLIKGNIVSESGGVGVSASYGTVLGNTITSNAGFGISGSSGWGNNTLMSNNPGGAQVNGAIPLQPNACAPAC